MPADHLGLITTKGILIEISDDMNIYLGKFQKFIDLLDEHKILTA